MTYVDVKLMSQGTLMNIVSAFPKSSYSLRKHTIKLALRRHMLGYARAQRIVEERDRTGERGVAGLEVSTDSGDFLDRVHDASTKINHKQLASVDYAVALQQSSSAKGKRRSSLLGPNNVASPGSAGVHGGDGEHDLEEVVMDMRQDLQSLKGEMQSLRSVVERVAGALERQHPAQVTMQHTPEWSGDGA